MNELLDLLDGGNDASGLPTVRLGNIPSTYTSGRPTVIFDGEASASSKTYPVFGGYVPAPGDRVALLRSGNGWIVAGNIGDVTPPSGTTGSGVYAKLAGDTFTGKVQAPFVWAQSGLSGTQADKTLRAANADGWDAWFTVRTGAGSYNPYTAADNILLSYSGGARNNSPRFVIAPWNDAAGGLAIESNGSVSLASGQFVPDTRSTATTPGTYLGQRTNMWSFKSASTIGLSAGSFASVMGVAGWADDSGGGNHELAFADDGGMWHRYGTRSGGWGAWERIATNKQPEAWKDVVFLNGFSQWPDTAHNNVQYKKDALGFVHLRGCIKVSSSTPTASAFQLPVGYRPAKGLNFPAVAANAFGIWWVYADGNVAPRVTTAGQWMFLDGIRFEAEQ